MQCFCLRFMIYRGFLREIGTDTDAEWQFIGVVGFQQWSLHDPFHSIANASFAAAQLFVVR